MLQKFSFIIALLFPLIAQAATPSRVVTLMPSLGELAADILGTEIGKIVGVSDYTDYPPALKKIPSIGPYSRFNLELVLGLKPDLVLASKDGNSKDQVEHLRELGVHVVVVDTESFSSIQDSMRKVGEALGDPARGEKMATQFSVGLGRIRQRAAGRQPKRILMQIGSDPLITVGGASFLNDVIVAVGAKNVYGSEKVRYPRASIEDAITRAPEKILIMELGEDKSIFRKMAESWKPYKQIPAVRNGEIISMQADTVVRPTLRLLEGLSLLERAVYGPVR